MSHPPQFLVCPLSTVYVSPASTVLSCYPDCEGNGCQTANAGSSEYRDSDNISQGMISFSQTDPDMSALPPSYIFHPPHPSPPPPHPSIPPPAYTPKTNSSEGVTILLKCPHLSSFSWCLRLYAMVCGGMGVIFSILWVVGHSYVLVHSEDTDLRAQRYEGGFCYIPEPSQIIVIRCQSKILNSILCRFVDILLGLSLLLSHLVLCYGFVQ